MFVLYLVVLQIVQIAIQWYCVSPTAAITEEPRIAAQCTGFQRSRNCDANGLIDAGKCQPRRVRSLYKCHTLLYWTVVVDGSETLRLFFSVILLLLILPSL